MTFILFLTFSSPKVHRCNVVMYDFGVINTHRWSGIHQSISNIRNIKDVDSVEPTASQRNSTFPLYFYFFFSFLALLYDRRCKEATRLENAGFRKGISLGYSTIVVDRDLLLAMWENNPLLELSLFCRINWRHDFPSSIRQNDTD